MPNQVNHHKSKPYIGEKTVSSTNDAGESEYPHVEEWNWNHTINLDKSQLKDLSVRLETLKLIGENTGQIFQDTGTIKNFLKMPSIGWETISWISQWDYM